MTKKDTYIVGNSRVGSSLTLPNGQRVHTLDRGLFDRAVTAAEKYIDTRKSDDSRPPPPPRPAQKRA